MKQIIVIIALIALSFTSKAQNSLRLENNTNSTVYASYGIYEQSEKCWVTYGWYEIKAYNNFVLDLGDYTGQVYVHGQHQGLLTNKSWGDGEYMCVNEFKQFRIACARLTNCNKKKPFSAIQINSGENLFRFNP